MSPPRLHTFLHWHPSTGLRIETLYPCGCSKYLDFGGGSEDRVLNPIECREHKPVSLTLGEVVDCVHANLGFVRPDHLLDEGARQRIAEKATDLLDELAHWISPSVGAEAVL